MSSRQVIRRLIRASRLLSMTPLHGMQSNFAECLAANCESLGSMNEASPVPDSRGGCGRDGFVPMSRASCVGSCRLSSDAQSLARRKNGFPNRPWRTDQATFVDHSRKPLSQATLASHIGADDERSVRGGLRCGRVGGDLSRRSAGKGSDRVSHLEVLVVVRADVLLMFFDGHLVLFADTHAAL
jgi:hypothetical protein